MVRNSRFLALVGEVHQGFLSDGYQIGTAVAGGTAPMIAAALVNEFGGSWIPLAVFIALTGLISLLSILSVREMKGVDLYSGQEGK